MASRTSTPKVGWISGTGKETSFEVRTIYDLLDVVRQKPGLFIGEISLTALRGFIDGFRFALVSVANPFDVEDPPFTKGFDDWIAARFGFRESTSGWKNMLLVTIGDEPGAFDRFFIELDEYRQGASMSLWSLIGTPVERGHAIGIVIAACKALARADLRGGLTPSRVLVSSSGEVTIGAPDFSANILGYVAPELGAASASTVRLPSGGSLTFPTPSFESDEWRAAVFALGCMLWELLAGRRLFVGTTGYETVMLARAAAVPPIPGVAAELEAIVRRALAKNVESRYQTPMQLAEALARYLG